MYKPRDWLLGMCVFCVVEMTVVYQLIVVCVCVCVQVNTLDADPADDTDEDDDDVTASLADEQLLC